MKLIKLAILVGVALTTIQSVNADPKKPRKSWLDETTTVFVIGGNRSHDSVKDQARRYFFRSQRPGFRQVDMPRFVITDSKAKAAFAIGGFVNFRTAYDFNEVLPNLDFVTYDIPTTSTNRGSQRVLMDASTSRLYFKTIVATKKGPLVGYIETDFRGQGNSLRLREAYVSFMGFTLGQTVTTFNDPQASFNTIDFEGPNAYTYGRNLMIQYRYGFKNGISVGVAAEYPVVSATYGSASAGIYQRVPDIPAYVQYAWNEGKSHIRASGILRNMFYRDNASMVDMDGLGWGAQLSGVFAIGKRVNLYGQALYGKGITPYIQDLQGSGLDIVPNMMNNGRMSSPAAMAWLIGGQINVIPKLPVTLGYSQVTLFDNNNMMQGSDYRIGQYVVANVFYNISRTWNVGIEYLYGTRINFDGAMGHSNRIQAAVQFNF